MADPSHQADQPARECLLLYDGRCRLCVTAKQGLERLETRSGGSHVRMVAYQSDEAKQLLGESYRPGRPAVAFLVRPDGEITSGLDAFLPLLPGLTGGRLLAVLFKLPLVKPLGYLFYRLVARYRYRIFGEVPLDSDSGPAGRASVRPPSEPPAR
jgi:predicted DCC family thiol-disulfide oxidoreductase YuxK